MSYYIARLGVVFSILFSCAVYAADIPEDDEGAQQLGGIECISNATENCINDVCMTSEDVDCEDNCRKLAQEKCQQENN